MALAKIWSASNILPLLQLIISRQPLDFAQLYMCFEATKVVMWFLCELRQVLSVSCRSFLLLQLQPNESLLLLCLRVRQVLRWRSSRSTCRACQSWNGLWTDPSSGSGRPQVQSLGGRSLRLWWLSNPGIWWLSPVPTFWATGILAALFGCTHCTRRY